MQAAFLHLRSIVYGLCIGLAVLPSCEEVIDLGFEVPKSRLVINANIFPNEAVTLRVSATRPPGTPAVNIDKAQVMLFEGNELAEQLSYRPDPKNGAGGEYYTTDFQPREGKSYTLHVAAAGYDPVMAVSYIPAQIAIRSLAINELTMAEVEGIAVYDYKLVVVYDDPEGEKNYYDLRLSQSIVPFTINGRGDTVLASPFMKIVDTPGAKKQIGETLSVLLEDKGGEDSVTVSLQSRLRADSELLGGITAELRTVSTEYYYYQLSRGNQHQGQFGSGLREPVILFNNVESGLGIFAGYTAMMRQVPFAND